MVRFINWKTNTNFISFININYNFNLFKLLILSRSLQVTATRENIERGLLSAVSGMSDDVVDKVIIEQSRPTMNQVLEEKQRQNELIEEERKQMEEFKQVSGIIRPPESEPEILASNLDALERVKALGSSSAVSLAREELEDLKETQEEFKPIKPEVYYNIYYRMVVH